MIQQPDAVSHRRPCLITGLGRSGSTYITRCLQQAFGFSQQEVAHERRAPTKIQVWPIGGLRIYGIDAATAFSKAAFQLRDPRLIWQSIGTLTAENLEVFYGEKPPRGLAAEQELFERRCRYWDAACRVLADFVYPVEALAGYWPALLQLFGLPVSALPAVGANINSRQGRPEYRDQPLLPSRDFLEFVVSLGYDRDKPGEVRSTDLPV